MTRIRDYRTFQKGLDHDRIKTVVEVYTHVEEGEDGEFNIDIVYSLVNGKESSGESSGKRELKGKRYLRKEV